MEGGRVACDARDARPSAEDAEAGPEPSTGDVSDAASVGAGTPDRAPRPPARRARRIVRRARYLAARHAVLLVASAAALATMAVVPPDAAYAGYLDLRTIGCLFGILAVVAALRRLGVFERAARLVVDRFATCRGAVAALVGATLVLSMVATNDMALIMMLPLAAATLLEAGWGRALPVAFVLQNLAANLGGMVLPFGNPQNLYLYEFFGIPLGDFLATMALPFAVSVALIALCCALLVPVDAGKGVRAGRVTPRREEGARPAENVPAGFDRRDAGDAGAASRRALSGAGEGSVEPGRASGVSQDPAGRARADAERTELAPSRGAAGGACAGGGPSAASGARARVFRPRLSRRARALICLGLLVLMVAYVLRVVPWPAAVAVVAGALLALDRRALAQVDYGLLLTFACFFVFAGNMARIPQVVEVLAPLMADGGLWVSAGASQVISNVPAAVLLSHFTGEWAPLLVGVNVGGAGTLVASLAGLITFSHYRSVRALFARSPREGVPRTRVFLAWFTALGFAFLAVLLAVCAAAFA